MVTERSNPRPRPSLVAVPPTQANRSGSSLRRMTPTKGEAGIVALSTAVPFLMGAVPEGGGDLQGMIHVAVAAAASAAAGVAGKGAIVFLYSVARRWGKARKAKRLADKDPDNDQDVIADAVLDTVDRLDPEGKSPKGEE